MKSDRKRTVFELPTFHLFHVGAAGNQAEVGGGMAVGRQATLRVVDHLGDHGRRKLLLSANRGKYSPIRRSGHTGAPAPLFAAATAVECRSPRMQGRTTAVEGQLAQRDADSAVNSDRRISIHKSG